MRDVVQAVLGFLATVLRDFEPGFLGQRLVDFIDQLAEIVCHRHRAGFTRTRDGDADVGMAVTQAEAG